ncbi:hypothetical protein BSK43_030805 [Rhizobium sp. P44RR-XXIV]|nr:hypothetical protein BSK43_030805 [Rhizobium sp. P44RR-XXIV]
MKVFISYFHKILNLSEIGTRNIDEYLLYLLYSAGLSELNAIWMSRSCRDLYQFLLDAEQFFKNGPNLIAGTLDLLLRKIEVDLIMVGRMVEMAGREWNNIAH